MERWASQISGCALDLGCGSKPYKKVFAEVSEYVGIDVQVSGHDHATSKVDVYFDGRTIPFPDAYFDSLVSFEVLEHVEDIDGILAECFRVLKPGGRILISMPFAWDEHEQPFDFRRLTSFGAHSLFKRSGFDDIVITKSGNYVEAVGQLWAAYLWHYIATRNTLARIFVQALLIFPSNLLTLLLARVLPPQDSLFCSLILECRRPI